MDAIEEKFHTAMICIYEDAKKAGYNASYFLRMVSDLGGVETAYRLIMANKPSDGFTNLWELGRLDLSVEALILAPEWEYLFGEEERAFARKRLEAYAYEM